MQSYSEVKLIPLTITHLVSLNYEWPFIFLRDSEMQAHAEIASHEKTIALGRISLQETIFMHVLLALLLTEQNKGLCVV